MNKTIVIATAMLGLVASGPVAADVIGFTGPFAPGSFTIGFTGTILGGTSGSTIATQTALTINGGNGTGGCVGGVYGFLGPCEVDATHSTAGLSDSIRRSGVPALSKTVWRCRLCHPMAIWGSLAVSLFE